MTRHAYRLPIYGGSLLALALGAAAWGQDEPNEISECDVFIEINATDEDAGWQGLLDASPWSSARILGPDERGRHHHDGDDDDDDDDDEGKGRNGKELLAVDARGELRKHGMTEYRWESAEPTFDEFSLEDFLARFPEGEYQCHVKFIHGKPKQAMEEDELTHCLPDGPVITDPGELPAGVDWTVMWTPVTRRYDQDGPGLGEPLADCGPEEGFVMKYSVTVEFENDITKVMTFDVLPTGNPTETAIVPGDFLGCGLEGKVEIGAFVPSGNSTFREIPIATSPCGL
jgi:hypothetical protein